MKKRRRLVRPPVLAEPVGPADFPGVAMPAVPFSRSMNAVLIARLTPRHPQRQGHRRPRPEDHPPLHIHDPPLLQRLLHHGIGQALGDHPGRRLGPGLACPCEAASPSHHRPGGSPSRRPGRRRWSRGSSADRRSGGGRGPPAPRCSRSSGPPALPPRRAGARGRRRHGPSSPPCGRRRGRTGHSSPPSWRRRPTSHRTGVGSFGGERATRSS